MKDDATLVLCVSNGDSIRYYLRDVTFSGFQIELEYNISMGILESYCGNVYVLGYLYNGKFFDQFVYLGKGKRLV